MPRKASPLVAKRAASWILLGFVALALLIVGFGPNDRAISKASAQTASTAETAGANLTVYNDLALVEDQRAVTLTKGTDDYQLLDVTDMLLPDSVHIEAPELQELADIMILEEHYQHAQYLGLDRLLASYLGKSITVFAPGGVGTYRGKLLSTQGGIVLEDENGMVQVIRDATRFTFPGYQIALSPQLSLKLDSPIAGPQPLRLSYLTEGLQWEVSYLGIVNASTTQMDLESTTTVSNDSGLTFRGAQLTLVAGQLHRANQPSRPLESQSLAKAAAPPAPFQEQPSFEYHRYDLGRPVDLPTAQTVQMTFVTLHDLSVEQRYLYDAQQAPGVQIHIIFTNPETQSGSQGVALPAGLFRLYQRGPTGLQFVGEDMIGHTPQGKQVDLTTGAAFDLTANRVRTAHESPGAQVFRDSYEVTLTNHKTEAVTIEVREHPEGIWKIVSAQPNYAQLDASTIAFTVPVAAGETTTIKYTVEYHY